MRQKHTVKTTTGILIELGSGFVFSFLPISLVGVERIRLRK
jgi:hypothetical protein